MVSQKFVDRVGRSPWTAAEARVGLHGSMEEPDQGSGADEGVRPTATYLADFSLRTLGPFRRSLCGSHIAPLTRGVVVGIGHLLHWPHVFWDVSQIDSNAGPGRRTAAHRVY
jgi:hypothetical protein